MAHLNEGNITDAESFLQLAARWAQTPLQQLIALSNLGKNPKIVQWSLFIDVVYCSGTVNLFALNADQNTDPNLNVLFLRENRFKNEQYKPVEANSEKVPQLLKDAVSYWEESLRDAQKSIVTVRRNLWILLLSNVFVL